MDLASDIFLMPFICGGIFLVAGAVMYSFPPRGRNYFYGYRTPASMRSEESWKFAQPYAAARLLESGGCLVLISFYTIFIHLAAGEENVIGLLFIGIAAAYLFYRTENALNKNFPNP